MEKRIGIKWKRTKFELNDEIGNMIIADLENNIDIKNAMLINIEDKNEGYISSSNHKE